jgi:hypothetical protein
MEVTRKMLVKNLKEKTTKLGMCKPGWEDMSSRDRKERGCVVVIGLMWPQFCAVLWWTSAN